MASSSAAPAGEFPQVKTFERSRPTASMRSVDIEDYFVISFKDVFAELSLALLIQMRILNCHSFSDFMDRCCRK